MNQFFSYQKKISQTEQIGQFDFQEKMVKMVDIQMYYYFFESIFYLKYLIIIMSQIRKKNFKLRDFPLHGAKVNSVQISRQSKEFFVTGDNQNNVRLYMISKDQQINCFNPNTNNAVQTQVAAVSFNCLQTQVFSGSNRGIINVWDITTGKSSCTLKGHPTAVNCFGIFPEQPQRLSSGSYDTQIKLWDIRSKNNTGTLKHHTKPINSIDISPDCRMLISGSQDATIKLWDLRYPQRLLATYTQHTAPVLKVKFNPQDCMFASCSTDKTAKYFRCEANHYNYLSSTQVVATPITAIDFSFDGTHLFTAANDLLKIWNMKKNGQLIDQIQSSWKNVMDIACIKGGLAGISANGGYLSVWVSNIEKKGRQSRSQLLQNKLPNIHSKNTPFKFEEMKQALNNINYAMDVVNNLDIRRLDKKNESVDVQRQKLSVLQRQKQRQLQRQRQRQRQQRQRQIEKQRQLRIKIQYEMKMQEQRRKRQQMQEIQRQKLERQRFQRQKMMEQKIQNTLNDVKNDNFQASIQNDLLDNSSLMNISAFLGDGVQKQRLRQIQLIGDLTKDSSKFQSIINQRAKSIKPIIHYWKQGKIKQALYTLNQVQITIVSDCISAIVYNGKFKSSITPQVAVALMKKLTDLMLNKHSTYVKNAMNLINELVLMFKDELIKVKTFNPMTRVDLARQQRLAKYDLLIQQMLNIFRQQRLKRYALAKKMPQNEELNSIAAQLYKNLQDILKKIMPKKQPEAA